MRHESLPDAIELASSEGSPEAERLTVETTLSLELRRTGVLLAIFVGLLLLRFG